MYLAKDYVHSYKGWAGEWSRCRIRLYLPYEGTDAAAVICSELPDNPGSSVSDAAEQIAAEIIAGFKLPLPPVWIEHHPVEATGDRNETFELVVFAHYDVQSNLRGGVLHKEIGPPTRKPLDRKSVEMLVGQYV
jgi:hypothetical protein